MHLEQSMSGNATFFSFYYSFLYLSYTCIVKCTSFFSTTGARCAWSMEVVRQAFNSCNHIQIQMRTAMEPGMDDWGIDMTLLVSVIPINTME